MQKDQAPKPGRPRRKRPASTKPNSPPAKPEKTARDYEQTTKRRGELSELAFVYKAASLGFPISKPYGDSERYDFILDAGHRLLRIQVKSTTAMLCGLYRVNTYRRTNKGVIAYQPGEVDFLVARVIPEDTWFIFPIAAVQDRTAVLLPPRRHPRARTLHADYREAWHLLREV